MTIVVANGNIWERGYAICPFLQYLTYQTLVWSN